MKRFILPTEPGPDRIIRLYDKDYHYLVRVKRLKPGMSFDAVIPNGAETRIRILSTADDTLTGECTGEPENQPSPLPPIALFQGIPKGSKMDLIIRQAAEGSVAIVALFESEYSTAKAGKESFKKMKRWERIVKEARQQSGSTVETKVREPCSLEALLEFWASIKKDYNRPLGILLHQERLENGTFHGYLYTENDFIALAVGPEGGFSAS